MIYDQICQKVNVFQNSSQYWAYIYLSLTSFLDIYRSDYSIVYYSRLPSAIREIFSQDCLRFASFLGLYPSVYELLREILQTVRKKKVQFHRQPKFDLSLAICLNLYHIYWRFHTLYIQVKLFDEFSILTIELSDTYMQLQN